MTRKRKTGTATGTKPKRKIPRISREANYEVLPREAEWKDEKSDRGDLHYRLPIKTGTGWQFQDPVVLEENKESSVEDEEEEEKREKDESQDSEEVEWDSDLDEGLSDKEEKEKHGPEILTTAQLLAKREAKMNKKKDLIAECAARVLEDPQTNVHLLSKLRWICVDRNPDIAITIRKLAMLSLVAIYKDIIPGYRIRDLTPAEKAVKVSKDTRQLRDFEQKLVKYYNGFITILSQTVQAGLNEKIGPLKSTTDVTALESNVHLTSIGLESLAEVALQCVCELSIAANHFNCRERLFTCLVRGLVSGKLMGKVGSMCCEAISTIFRNDLVGEVSLEIVQIIAKLVKARNYYTKPQVLQPFVYLNLQHVEEPVSQLGSLSKNEKLARRKKKLERQRFNRKQRRKNNARIRLEKELRETEAEERIEKKVKLQTEIIKLVFLIYFRVLKQAQDSPLLSTVLEGLAKYAHLISVDYFADLMSVLHSLMEKNALSSQQAMQCISTAFHILSGQGEALNIDPRQFYCQLYTNLLQLDHRTTQYNMLLVFSCLEKVARQKKKISSARVQGLIKRIATVLLQLPSSASLGLMATLRQFVQNYQSYCEVLLSNEEDCANGVYQPDVPDPELSGSSSTHLWELATLRLHFDPYISSYAEHLIKGAPSQGPGSLHSDFSQRTPVQLMESHNWQLVDPFSDIPLQLQRKTRRAPYREN